MANLVVTVDGLTDSILIAEERETRRFFRSLEPRNVCVVDVDTTDDFNEAAALALLTGFVADHSSRWRAYRTHSGVRYIELSEIWTPRTQVIKELMSALSADSRYVAHFVMSFQVGREKGTFSARIDPKPWNMVGGPTQESFLTMSQDEYNTLKAAWSVAKLNYRVAKFLGEYGNGGLAIHPWAQAVVDYHDAETRASVILPLA